MKFIFLFVFTFLLHIHSSFAQKPNIIIIMADDMGYSDIGCFGSEIATPNLDKLASSGLVMTQFYNASRCCPSRAALLTGLYPHQAGMGGMVNPKPFPAYQGYINKTSVTLAEVLKTGGYQTYMAGKWHVGQSFAHWPLQRGFDHYYGLIDGASSYFNPTKPYRPGQKLTIALDNKGVTTHKGWYATDVYTDYAIKYISSRSANQNPFFLYLAYTSPHWPLNAIKKDIEKYRGVYKAYGWDRIRKARLEKMIRLGILSKETKLSPREEYVQPWDKVSEQVKDEWDAKMAVYAAMIDRMDQNIGRLIDVLKKTGKRDNTIIFFLSDNGASHEEINRGFLPEILAASKRQPADPDSFTAYGKLGANVSNTPFRYYKHWQNEGGISTPFIVSYPNLISRRMISHQPAHIMDLMPTCLEAASVKYPSAYNGYNITPMSGKSFFPLIKGKKWCGHKTLFFEHEGNRAVRQKNWKLVSIYDQPGWKLYNMRNDRTEQIDVSNSHKKTVKKMQELYYGWAKDNGVVPYDELKKAGNKKSAD